jgi:type IV pilus assembly protein PilE
MTRIAMPLSGLRQATRVAGFTLLELMIVVAIVAILASIAVPYYADYIKRAKIIEATSALSDLRTRYEQYFLDNRTYLGGCVQHKAGVQAQSKAFTIDCAAGESASTYIGTATGLAAYGMSGFTYTIDQANVKSSTITAPGWTGNASCWAVRKSGDCQ